LRNTCAPSSEVGEGALKTLDNEHRFARIPIAAARPLPPTLTLDTAIAPAHSLLAVARAVSVAQASCSARHPPHCRAGTDECCLMGRRRLLSRSQCLMLCWYQRTCFTVTEVQILTHQPHNIVARRFCEASD
jgi:hypothetical protein